MSFYISDVTFLLCAILALYFGKLINSHISFLKSHYIPSSVTGGIFCTILLMFLRHFFDIQVTFDLHLRDFLLLSFFSAIGLSAQLSSLIQGGKVMGLLMVATFIFLLLQNLVGVLTALTLDENPIFGLLAGTITFAGGHGTAITWGNIFEQQGILGAKEFAITAATIGLILGGVIGGPLAKHLMRSNKLLHNSDPNNLTETPEIDVQARNMTLNGHHIVTAIFLISLCIVIGLFIQSYLRSFNIIVPDFLPVLLVGVTIVNLYGLTKTDIKQVEIDTLGDICLQLFVVMSLMDLKIQYINHMMTPLVVISLMQILMIVLYARYVIFKVAGNNFDGSVISAGFIGMGLGATPVGMANMQSLTKRYGPSPKAFFIVPLLGSFFVDISNAFILQGYLWVFSVLSI